ncbi:MAG: family 78 glycoside hydrolase catalytic domain [Clostridia bacterium]|nr:family 78 glycoside hydrolase catalytic domain [Clostridia bacterium]
MNKASKIFCIVCGIIIAAALIYGFCTFEPDYKNRSDSFTVSGLTVNYEKDPVGVMNGELTFGWQMKSEKTGMTQTAYRIVVSDKDSFSGKTYWDTGKVRSSESACVQYGGLRLDPEKEYYWKVTVWDGKDEYSTSTETAHFETGADEKSLKKAAFICEGMNKKTFDNYYIEFDASITSEALGVLVDVRNSADYLLWQFNIVDHGVLYLRKHVFTGGGYTIEEVDISRKCGADITYGDVFHVKITSDGKNIVTYVNSNKVDSFARTQKTAGAYGFRQGAGEAGRIDNLRTELNTKAFGTISASYDFESGNSNPFTFGTVSKGCLDIGPFSGEQKSYISFDGTHEQTDKSGGVMFRKNFELGENPIKKARVYVTALGNFNLYLNGMRVGDDVLKPGWTDYTNRVQYFTYDVADMLQTGENVFCSVVTSGWWNGDIARGTYGGQDNAFLLRLVVEYRNGRKYELVTDSSWEWNRSDCPVTSASIYGGETYDARLPLTVYMPDKYDPAAWSPADIFDGFNGEITPESGASVKVRKEYERVPESIVLYQGTVQNGSDYGTIDIINEISGDGSFTLEKGETAVIDLGQNMVGWPEIVVSGAKNTVITMHFGEMLNDSGKASRGNDGPEGSVYKANYRSAASTNKYILNGDAEETYHTEYSFYGFRYISITVTDRVVFKSVRGQVVGSDNPVSGTIETSDGSVNKLISNIMWSMMGNYVSVPTDCPQRDERLGWTGDTQVFVGTGSYNANVAPFFRKWLQDCIDSQVSDGSYPDVVPRNNATGSGAAAWGDAGIIVPYTMYKKYGDTYVISRNYDSMEKYMEFVIKNDGPLERYGDWLAYQGTDQRLICTAYYAYDAMLMAEMSEALGYASKAAYYRGIYEKVKQEYIDDYFGELGFNPDSQTSAIVTLLADLVPDDEARKDVLDQLVYNIQYNGNKLQTGFVGTASIMTVLSRFREDETAYTLLLQRNNPSWLYSVDQGATTTWERWDSYTLTRGFGDVGMNSFNHYAYGCVGEWMYAYMAGINGYGTAGFKDFVLSPRFDPQRRITYVNAEYDSVYGTIVSRWNTFEDGKIAYSFEVPANTSCTVELPLSLGEKEYTAINVCGNDYEISGLEAGKEIAEGLSFAGIENGCIIIKAVSGGFTIGLA